MRIIEGNGPPSQDTFGNSDYLYKDVDTGAFYYCSGNINEDRVLPYGAANTHQGEQYLWTPVGVIMSNGSGSTGGAEVKTCTVRIKSGRSVKYYGVSHYSKYENGEIVLVSDISGEETQEFDFVFENVVCGSVIMFHWEQYSNDMGFDMMEPNVIIEGSNTASQITNAYFDVVGSYLFVAPSEQGANCVITIDAYDPMNDV